MEKIKYETVKVYSPVEDKGIKKNLVDSPMWEKAIHADDLAEELTPGKVLYEYTIKFDGPKPVQVNNVKKVAK